MTSRDAKLASGTTMTDRLPVFCNSSDVWVGSVLASSRTPSIWDSGSSGSVDCEQSVAGLRTAVGVRGRTIDGVPTVPSPESAPSALEQPATATVAIKTAKGISTRPRTATMTPCAAELPGPHLLGWLSVSHHAE